MQSLIMSEKKEPDERMIIDLGDKRIDIDMFVSSDKKGLRYDLNSKDAIDPMDAAFCLWCAVKSICEFAGVNPEVLTKEDLAFEAEPSQHH